MTSNEPTVAQEPTNAQELQQELHSRLAMHRKSSEIEIPAMLDLHPHAAREFRLWCSPVACGERRNSRASPMTRETKSRRQVTVSCTSCWCSSLVKSGFERLILVCRCLWNRSTVTGSMPMARASMHQLDRQHCTPHRATRRAFQPRHVVLDNVSTHVAVVMVVTEAHMDCSTIKKRRLRIMIPEFPPTVDAD